MSGHHPVNISNNTSTAGQNSNADPRNITLYQAHRGRAPKDPNARVTSYECRDLNDLETHLKEYLSHTTVEDSHSTSCELTFGVDTPFLVNLPRAGQQALSEHQAQNAPLDNRNNSTGPMIQMTFSINDAMQPTSNPKDSMKKQRAIARTLTDAIQRIDGFRYSFHNCWMSREDGAYRFSYYCNDSLLNKDRTANGNRQHAGQRARKPVYDCKGVLSVKFSSVKQFLEITYKHVPLHKTYEQRAPPPRKGSKRAQNEGNGERTDTNSAEAPSRRPSAPARSTTTADQSSATAVGPAWSTEEAQPMEPPRKKAKKKQTPLQEIPAGSAVGSSTGTAEGDLLAQSQRSLLELMIRAPEQPAKDPSVPTYMGPTPTAFARFLDNKAGPANSIAEAMTTNKRGRVALSCATCRGKHIKCDGGQPKCKNCLETARPCIYTKPSRPSTIGTPSEAEPKNKSEQLRQANFKLAQMQAEVRQAEKLIRELKLKGIPEVLQKIKKIEEEINNPGSEQPDDSSDAAVQIQQEAREAAGQQETGQVEDGSPAPRNTTRQKQRKRQRPQDSQQDGDLDALALQALADYNQQYRDSQANLGDQGCNFATVMPPPQALQQRTVQSQQAQQAQQTQPSQQVSQIQQQRSQQHSRSSSASHAQSQAQAQSPQRNRAPVSRQSHSQSLEQGQQNPKQRRHQQAQPQQLQRPNSSSQQSAQQEAQTQRSRSSHSFTPSQTNQPQLNQRQQSVPKPSLNHQQQTSAPQQELQQRQTWPSQQAHSNVQSVTRQMQQQQHQRQAQAQQQTQQMHQHQSSQQQQQQQPKQRPQHHPLPQAQQQQQQQQQTQAQMQAQTQHQGQSQFPAAIGGHTVPQGARNALYDEEQHDWYPTPYHRADHIGRPINPQPQPSAPWPW